MKKERNSNYELMRIISMFFIVISHVIYHGHVIENCENQGLKIILELIKFFTIIHVNSFILVTGYFQSKGTFKQSKFWKLINASLFYRITILIILMGMDLITLNKASIFYDLLPLDTFEYWFIKCYIFLYCLSPFLNKAIESLNKNTFRNLLIVMFLLFSTLPYISGGAFFDNNGYTLYHFIFLYLLGAYFRLYPFKESFIMKQLSKKAFRLLMVIIFLSSFLMNYIIFKFAESFGGINFLLDIMKNNLCNASLNYSNPFVIIQSVAFFMYFGTFSFKNTFINFISSLVMGVYFIHDNSHVRELLYKALKIENGPVLSYEFLIHIFLCSLLILIVCLIIEYLRQLIFKFIYERKISTKIREKYYSYLDSLKA